MSGLNLVLLPEILKAQKLCKLYEETDYSIEVLRKGTILYNGNCMPTKFRNNKFWAFHPLGKITFNKLTQADVDDEKHLMEKALEYKSFIIFFSSDYNAAEGYAGGCQFGGGLVNKFEVKEDLLFLNDLDLTGHETKYVAECVCGLDKKFGIKAYGILYKDKHGNVIRDEFAICDPEKYLKFLGTVYVGK